MLRPHTLCSNLSCTIPSGLVSSYVWNAWPSRCASGTAMRAVCSAGWRTISICSSANWTPSSWNDATIALAVPEVSTLLLWCDSATVMLYPVNAPGNESAMIFMAACVVTQVGEPRQQQDWFSGGPAQPLAGPARARLFFWTHLKRHHLLAHLRRDDGEEPRGLHVGDLRPLPVP
jgi:hypothetical protein